MTTILYASNTGTAARYAQLLSEKTGFPCVAITDADWETVEDAVLLGWILGGDVQGLRQAQEKGVNLLAVGGVGIMEQEAEKVREKNCPDIPFFFLPGAFDVKKQKGLYKMMTGMIVRVIKSKVKNDDSPESKKVLDFFENGVDLFREDALDALAAELC